MLLLDSWIGSQTPIARAWLPFLEQHIYDLYAFMRHGTLVTTLHWRTDQGTHPDSQRQYVMRSGGAFWSRNSMKKTLLLCKKSQSFLLSSINLATHPFFSFFLTQDDKDTTRKFPLFTFFVQNWKTILCYHDMPKQWHVSSRDHCFSPLQVDYYWMTYQMLEKCHPK